MSGKAARISSGLYISGRHHNDPRRKTVSADARTFELVAHSWLSRRGGDGHLTLDDVDGIREKLATAWPGWDATELLKLATELYDAGLWEHFAERDDSEGWFIAAPTIRYWRELADGAR